MSVKLGEMVALGFDVKKVWLFTCVQGNEA